MMEAAVYDHSKLYHRSKLLEDGWFRIEINYEGRVLIDNLRYKGLRKITEMFIPACYKIIDLYVNSHDPQWYGEVINVKVKLAFNYN